MNSRPPPPQGAPPRYAFVNRVYTRNLRPVIIAFAFLSALWALFAAIGNFRSINIDNTEGFKKLGTFSIVLGAMYAAVSAFQSFGVFAAVTQRVPLIRIYTLLSVAVALLTVGAELLRVILHFTLKSDIIGICNQLLNGQTAVTYPFGFFGPVSHDVVNAEEAARWCQTSWDRDSWADIVSLLIMIVLAGLFTVMAFGYYRQVLDPSSAANVPRAPRNNVGAFPSHYNQPYNVSVPNLGYGYNMPYAGGPPPDQQPYQAYAPPAGPPPNHDDYEEYNKPPGYTGADGKAGANYMGDKEKENPFADFDDMAHDERDVTSRPGPGGRDRF